MNHLASKLDALFQKRFGIRDDRIIVRSPGRVNLIGEHTDYNEGFVLPASVDKAMIFVVAPRKDDQLHFHAADLNDDFSGSIAAIQKSSKSWPNYLLGVIDELTRSGKRLLGCDVVFGADIPIGAGMSSSAAIECGLAFALNELFRLDLGKLDLVKLGQRAENKFVGVQCGIMDQFVNIFGQDRKVLKIDCRTLDFEYFPFERPDLNIVLCETESKRSLASSEYNIRRQQCEAGVTILRRHNKEISSLRDVTTDFLLEHRAEMEPVIYQRCEYVVQENQRVLAACEALQRNDFRSFGEKMYQSHDGLSRGYQVSSPDLDFLVDAASSINGVLGARMMGAGFGGCTINLVEQARVQEFVDTIHERCRKRSGTANNVYVTRIESGTGLVSAL
ncbi:MAG: galactokinase [Ignavibacteriales bacterium]|nr:galactokinase [Ignavibacteriales bacterium]